SCQGLQESLTYLLQSSGAQLNRPVIAYPCNGGGPTSLPSANLDFSTLQAAQGDHGSDCELVQEFKDKLLPMFSTRNVSSNLHCIPHQTIGNQFHLSFDVLAPV